MKERVETGTVLDSALTIVLKKIRVKEKEKDIDGQRLGEVRGKRICHAVRGFKNLCNLLQLQDLKKLV